MSVLWCKLSAALAAGTAALHIVLLSSLAPQSLPSALGSSPVHERAPFAALKLTCFFLAVWLCSTENEKNRRRDLVTALRTRREQMLQSLKREQPRAAREALLGGAGGGSTSALTAGAGRETDTTAELGSQGLLQMQQQVMQQQDQELESLERTVVGTKHIALQVGWLWGGAAGMPRCAHEAQRAHKSC